MGDQVRQGEADTDAQWETLAIYEQILTANPNDADALDELFRACLAVGEKTRAYGYGERLARHAITSEEPERMRAVHALVSPHAAADDGIRRVVQTLAAMAGIGRNAETPVPGPSAVAAAAGVARPAPQAAEAPAAAVSGSADIIAMVSKILENMPDDRESLNVLAAAYMKMGDDVQAASSLSRLADVLIRDQDYDAAAPVLEKLEALKRGAPEAAQAAGRLAKFLNRVPVAADKTGQGTAGTDGKPLSLAIDATRRRAVLADEMDLLWDLQQQGLVTEALYAGVVRDLTELTSSDSITTISALHGLSFRGFAGLDALLVQLGAKASAPVITLGGFDLQPAVFCALPLDYLTFQGVIPFERMGGECLVAVLNPFSQRMRQELVAALGCPCHFFLMPPADFDIALEVVKNRYKAEQDKK